VHVSPSSTDWYARGKHSFYAGRYRTAVDYLTNSIVYQSSMVDQSLLLRAQLYVLLGNFTGAKQVSDVFIPLSLYIANRYDIVND
jgi:outer membrane protein assembly factor BamD (BamD/ComL family)